MTTEKINKLIDRARDFLFVREAGQNKGLMVESIIHWSGGIPGQSWCAYFVLFIFDIVYGGKDKNPLVRSGAVQDIYEEAKNKGWMVEDGQPGDLFIYVIPDKDHAHHIGIVTARMEVNEDGKLLIKRQGIAGNTSADGKSSNGDRVAEHEIISGVSLKFIHIPDDV